MKIISVWTPKGGVGKTTTTLHLADCISQELGLKVLVYDVDDQLSLYDTVKDEEANFDFEVTDQFPEDEPDCDVFIMDFRPSGMRGKGALTRQEIDLLKKSDVIVSPIRASRLDIKSQNAIKNLETRAEIIKVLCCLDLSLFSFKSFSFPKPEAARSLAIPRTPRQSGLLGVIDKSIILEFNLEK